ncbi:PREDICTED: uncharacterized protein LOC106807827 [Priapulus caudatus]|uniref:Uncharacterized protein LOC106807827 n=1 Tax=Priapulus caudatus TaxID=37621 RepID=A0ABM1E0Q7_PRICU|nr:PREDICTED: uncharacterized protein LOC106807827 [Priapulus caudatus]
MSGAKRKSKMASMKNAPKPAADIKDELQQFDSKKLTHTQTVEKSALTHDSIMYGVSHYDKEKLTHTEVQEKVVLPDKEDVAQEKTHMNLLEGVASFDKGSMKHAATQEKTSLPHDSALIGVKGFNKAKLHHADTNEKSVLPMPQVIAVVATAEMSVLPDASAIEAERSHDKFIKGIEHFDAKQLKQVETQEKNQLPTKEVIEQERKA